MWCRMRIGRYSDKEERGSSRMGREDLGGKKVTKALGFVYGVFILGKKS